MVDTLMRPKTIVVKGSFPMRMFSLEKVDGHNLSELKCPYELAGRDNVRIQALKAEALPVQPIRVTLHSILTEAEKARKFRTFKRDLLLSRTSEKIFATMSGYLVDADVRVGPWKDNIDLTRMPPLDPEERKNMEIAKLVKMIHVRGFRNALARHIERVRDLALEPLTVQDGLEIYRAMLYTIPR